MYRYLYEELLKWKKNPEKKPLILNGARQVGKTWLLQEFGKKEYKNFVYVNCDNNSDIHDLFFNFDIERIVRSLSSLTNIPIEKDNSLIVFDEVQECPLALTSLKYFQEAAPEYHVIVAGSLLGVKIHEGTGFPVGKVDKINIYPLSFKEFLLAMQEDILVNYLDEHKWNDYKGISEKLFYLLREYYYVGGMPEVVSDYIKKGDYTSVRAIQNRILDGYRNDFSKHVPSRLLPKVFQVWDSIPSQLAKENKKFVYGAIRKGARAQEFENAIQWLIDAGLLFKVTRVKKLMRPLKFYIDIPAFKLFLLDLGLLGAMSNTTAEEVLQKNTIFEEYKGAFAEQYVAQTLNLKFDNIFYYTNQDCTNKLDFIIEKNELYPIEVKARTNTKSKSLVNNLQQNNDLKGFRFSMNNFNETERITNFPLYLLQDWTESI